MNEKLDNLDSYFSTDNLRDFLNIIGRSPSTTATENYILSRRIKSGDESAKKEMIEKNLKLVVSIAFKNRKILSSYDKLDLIQDGVLGLIRSIETYDETKGTFSNYATYWIEQAISRGLNQNNNLIRRPYQFEFKREKYRNLLISYRQNNIPIPDDETICTILGITPMVLQNIKDDLNLDTISLSDPFGNDSNFTYGDVIPSLEDPYQKLENSLVDSELLALLKTSLRDSEYYVLYYKILSGDDINFRELANTFCVSYQRIEQLLYNVIKKVRGFYDRERKIRKRVPQDIQDLIDTGVFNYSPIDPHNITRFLFIRDNLDEVEREIMRDVFFGKCIYSTESMAKRLNLDVTEVKMIEQNLQKKYADFFGKNEEKYKKFDSMIFQMYRTKIFNVDLDMDISLFVDPEEKTLQ